MSVRIFISHAAADQELGTRLVELLQPMIAGARVNGSSLPGHVPLGGDDSFAALKQQLADADVVVGVLTPHAVGTSEVPFQLGAAWALGKRIVLLLAPEGGAEQLYLPMGYADTLVLGPEALLELAASIAAGAGLRSEYGPAAREALRALFPDWQGLDRESTERAVPAQRDSGTTQQQWPVDADGNARPMARPAPITSEVPRPGLPNCSASLEAGRAISDCVLNRNQTNGFADELDGPFGAFLSALGGNWAVLRDLEDLDVWLESADNMLGGLAPTEQYVRAWYELGFRLATVVNLAGLELASGAPQDAASWDGAWTAFRIAAQEAMVDPNAVEELRAMVENLRGPLPSRDYANLGRVQERVRELAHRVDSVGIAIGA